MTVDWSKWMEMTDAQKAALWARYRAILRSEIDDALYTRFARMDAALFNPFDYQWQVERINAVLRGR